MTTLTNQRVTYFNGGIVPDQVSIRDRSFKYGDAVFDMTRTFGHRIFRIKEQVHGFYRSLRYVCIDPGFGRRDPGVLMVTARSGTPEQIEHVLARARFLAAQAATAR